MKNLFLALALLTSFTAFASDGSYTCTGVETPEWEVSVDLDGEKACLLGASSCPDFQLDLEALIPITHPQYVFKRVASDGTAVLVFEPSEDGQTGTAVYRLKGQSEDETEHFQCTLDR